MSRAASSAVTSDGRRLAARMAATNLRGVASNTRTTAISKRSEISKRGPKAEPGNKQMPAVPRLSSSHIPSSRRSAEPRARDGRNPARFASISGSSVLKIPRKSASRTLTPARVSRPRILSAPISKYDSSARVVLGRAGDHPDIYQLLLAVFQGPSREEFSASQDDPNYEPANRLLVKQGALV